MEQLFTRLTHAVEGAPALALAAALAWGVLSLVLSPCHLTSIPLIVGFIGGQGRLTTARAGATATLFAVGILLTIAGLGVITAAAGRLLGDIGRWGNYLVAAVLVLVGLYLLGVIPLPWTGLGRVDRPRRGLLAALGLGLVFGLAVGPCTFAYLAPMLAVTLRQARTNPVYAGALLLAYGVGHCAIIGLAGTFTGLVQRFLDWHERSRGLAVLKSVCGVLVILGGVWLAWGAP